MSKPQFLLVHTLKDKIFPFFVSSQVKELVDMHFVLYEESNEYLQKFMQEHTFDYIYLHSTIHADLTMDERFQKFEVILNNKKNAYIIDSISKPDHVLLDDKWSQYQRYSEFMPPTFRPTTLDQIDFNKHFVKKSFSGRSLGVAFSKNDIDNINEYIVQDKLDIEKEYRIYTIQDEIVEPILVRQSKTHNQKTRVVNAISLTPQLKEYVQQIMSNYEQPYDLMGLDIVETADNKLYLLELNPNALITAHYRLTNVNLAAVLIKKLLS